MNWIDDKYKEKLGNQKFPDSLKEAGWAKAEKLLDKEMPLAPGGGMGVFGKSFLALLALIAIPSAIWYFTQSSELPAEDVMVPIMEQNESTSSRQNSNEDGELTPLNIEDKNTENVESKSPNNAKDLSEKNNDEEIANSNGSLNEAKSDGPFSSKAEGEVNQPKAIAAQPQENESTGTPVTSKSSGVDSPKESDEARSGDNEDGKPNFDISTSAQNGKDVEDDSASPKSSVEDGLNTSDKQNSGQSSATQSDSGDEPEPIEDLNIVNDSEESNSNEEDQNPELSEEQNVIQSQENSSLDSLSNEPEEKEQGEDEIESPTPDLPNTAKSAKLNRGHMAFLDLPANSAAEDQYQFFARERFSLSLWGGYTYTDKFLSSDNSEYDEKRKAEENAIWTTPTGIELDYFLDGRWTVGLGLRWSEYGEDIQYDLSQRDTAWIDGRVNSPDNFSNVVMVDSARIITGINQGHWNYVVVTEKQDSAALLNNGKTSWQYVEIPLTLGYRFGTGTFRPWVKTGVSIGIPISTTFRYLNPQATQLSDAGLTYNKLVAPLQYNYLIDFGVDCYINRNFSIRLNATSSMQLNSSLRQSTIKQRYYRLGMGIGLAYNF